MHWHADWTVPLTRYERGLQTYVLGVTDAKAHESWKLRGFQGRNKRAIARALSSGELDATKFNSEGETYSAVGRQLDQQTYRGWLNGADAGDSVRQLGSFVRALSDRIDAEISDRDEPRLLRTPITTPEPREWWPQDEVRGRAIALLMFLGLSFAEAYAFSCEQSGDTRRGAWHKLQAARKSSHPGELRIPNPANGLSQSVRHSLNRGWRIATTATLRGSCVRTFTRSHI